MKLKDIKGLLEQIDGVMLNKIKFIGDKEHTYLGYPAQMLEEIGNKELPLKQIIEQAKKEGLIEIDTAAIEKLLSNYVVYGSGVNERTVLSEAIAKECPIKVKI